MQRDPPDTFAPEEVDFLRALLAASESHSRPRLREFCTALLRVIEEERKAEAEYIGNQLLTLHVSAGALHVARK